jgi:DNA-binding Lrp family transcriptional regulator
MEHRGQTGDGNGASKKRSRKRHDPSIDTIDRKLLELLASDGRATNRRLATLIGINEATIASHIRNLIDNRVMRITAVFDFEAAGYAWQAITLIRTRARSPRDVAADVAALPGAWSVSVVSGRVDLLAVFLVVDKEDLTTLVRERLPDVAGIDEFQIDLASSFSAFRFGVLRLGRAPEALALPAPCISLDGVDLAVIHELVGDGRQSAREIGRTLSVSEGMVRARVRRLEGAGLMRITALADASALGAFGAVAFVRISVDIHRTRSAADEIATRRGVVTVATCAAVSSVIALITAGDREAIADVVDELRVVPGVLASETFDVIHVAHFASHWARLSVSPRPHENESS